MNKSVLIGRATKNPELRFTTGAGVAVATFTIAVDRDYKGVDGQRVTDFIPIVCWRGLAENVANHVVKGMLVAVSGSIQTRKYQATDGTNRYATEVVADGVQFLEWKKDGDGTGNGSYGKTGDGDDLGGFMPVDGDDDIPF